MDQSLFLKELTELTTIIYRINRSLTQNKDCDEFRHVPGAQIQTMIILRKSKPLNMTVLSEHLLMPRQQMTKIIDALVEKGFVRREKDPDNRRHVMVEMTEEGNHFVDDLMINKPNMLTMLLSALDEADAEKMLAAVVQIREILEKLADSRKKTKE